MRDNPRLTTALHHHHYPDYQEEERNAGDDTSYDPVPPVSAVVVVVVVIPVLCFCLADEEGESKDVEEDVSGGACSALGRGHHERWDGRRGGVVRRI